MTRILACTDGSAYASSVYAHAAWAAGRLHAGVTVLHAIEPNRTAADPPAPAGGPHPDALLAAAARHLAEEGVAPVGTAGVPGPLADGVAAFDAEPALVVLGKRGEKSHPLRTELGDNVERVVRHNRGPFLVTDRKFAPIERALFAFDASVNSTLALEFLLGSELLAHVPVHLLGAGEGTPPLREALEEALARLVAAGRAATMERVEAFPDIAIAVTARKLRADLLVMGAFGHSRIRSLFFGSTTRTMLRALPISALLFR